jgi:hypothetical protein
MGDTWHPVVLSALILTNTAQIVLSITSWTARVVLTGIMARLFVRAHSERAYGPELPVPIVSTNCLIAGQLCSAKLYTAQTPLTVPANATAAFLSGNSK